MTVDTSLQLYTGMTQRVDFDEDQLTLMKNTIAKGSTDDELALFVAHCRRTGLDPFARQIYSIRRKQWDSQTRSYEEAQVIQVSIDGSRVIAERSGQYAGQVGPWWCGPDGEWKEIWLANEPPAAAKVGALRHDFLQPMYGIAPYSAYVQTNARNEPMARWKTDPAGMLAKCAESLALRKAFPNDMGGLYTTEEMGQADNPHTLQLDAGSIDGTFILEPGAVITTEERNHDDTTKDENTSLARQDGEPAASQGEKVRTPTAKVDAPKNGAQSHTEPLRIVLTLEAAEAEQTSDWKPYGSLTLDELQNRKAGIVKALKGTKLDAEKRPTYERKLAALELLIPLRAAAVAEAAQAVGLADTGKRRDQILNELGYGPEPEQPPMLEVAADKYADLKEKAKTDPAKAFWILAARLKWNTVQGEELIKMYHGDIDAAWAELLKKAEAKK